MKPLKIFVIGILIFILAIFCYLVYDYYHEEKIDFQGFKISINDLEELLEAAPEGEFRLCSIEEGRCLVLEKMEVENGIDS